MPDTSLLIGLLGAFVAMVTGIVAFAPSLLSRGSTQRSRRVDMVRRRWAAGAAATDNDEVTQISRDAATGRFKLLEQMAKRVLPRPENLRKRLLRTGKKISLGSYFAANLACAAGGLIVAEFILSFPTLFALFAAVAAGAGLPHFYVGRLAKKREKKFTEQFPEAIDLIVRGLKSGLPVSESVRLVGVEMQDPVGTEFRGITSAQGLGQSLEAALWEATKRLDTPEFKFFVISLSVQRETGGNLAETLQNLSDILRKRRHMRMKVKALSSEARSSAMIIGSLPFIMFGILLLVSRSYVLQLFDDPRGLVMIGVGLTSMALGVFVMARMVSFKI